MADARGFKGGLTLCVAEDRDEIGKDRRHISINVRPRLSAATPTA